MGDRSPIFQRVGTQTFVATPAAGGPWNEGYCHGGAPAALLASALEGVVASVPMDMARLTVDLMQAVPLDQEVRVEVRQVRQGRTVQRVVADLLAAGRMVARATALKVRSRDAQVDGLPAAAPPSGQPMPMPGSFSEQFTILAVQGSFGEPGPASAWFRLNVQLIAGEDASPLSRAVAAADFGSGLAHELAFDAWSFPSLDLHVSLVRPPMGSWTLLQSQWLGTSVGRTSCKTRLCDAHGAFGEASQTVLLEPRSHQ